MSAKNCILSMAFFSSIPFFRNGPFFSSLKFKLSLRTTNNATENHSTCFYFLHVWELYSKANKIFYLKVVFISYYILYNIVHCAKLNKFNKKLSELNAISVLHNWTAVSQNQYWHNLQNFRNIDATKPWLSEDYVTWTSTYQHLFKEFIHLPLWHGLHGHASYSIRCCRQSASFLILLIFLLGTMKLKQNIIKYTFLLSFSNCQKSKICQRNYKFLKFCTA